MTRQGNYKGEIVKTNPFAFKTWKIHYNRHFVNQTNLISNGKYIFFFSLEIMKVAKQSEK